MRTFPNLVICEHCDSVYTRRILAPRETAYCNCCGATLYRAGLLNVDRRLALTVAAAIVFAIANACPVLRIGMQGLHSEATLWQAAAALAHGPTAPIALPAALALIVAPGLQICLLGWILVHARARRPAPGAASALRMLAALRPWSMVEVGLLALLVAVVKLAGFVDVAPGPGIWATAALVALLPLVAAHDAGRLWDVAGRAMPAREERA
jgi:paraquat-inducible protein A